MEWFFKADAQNNADAQNGLGLCYYNGYGVDQDYAKAAEYFTKAAEQDHIEAYHYLGDCHYNGYAFEQNYENAVEYYKKSAEQGYMLSQRRLMNFLQPKRKR